jgi:hypothetical protein
VAVVFHAFTLNKRSWRENTHDYEFRYKEGLQLGQELSVFLKQAAKSPADYPLLGSIDPYEDTYFTTFQLEFLAEELREATKNNPRLRNQVEDLVKWFGKCEPGTYVVCMGS